jgi:hypothetical protein
MLPTRFTICKDWHVTSSLLEVQRGGGDLTDVETMALNTVQLKCVKTANGATQAHDDRHTQPHAYTIYFGNDDAADGTVPVYICFNGGLANQNAMKQPLLLADCPWLQGKVVVSLARLAKRVYGARFLCAQTFTLDDAIEFFTPLLRWKCCHACGQWHSFRVFTLLSPVDTVNCIQTLKAVGTVVGTTWPNARWKTHPVGLHRHGARFPTEIYTRGCHWIPRMFA